MNYSKILSMVVLMLALGVGTGSAAEMGKPVVTVNGVNLYEADLNQEVQVLIPTATSYHSGINEQKMQAVRTKAMTALVDRELKYQDALARKQKLSKEALNAEIEKLKGKFSKYGDFNKIISGAGFTNETFGRFVERKILSDKMEKELVDDKVVISEEAAKAYYEQNKGRYMKPEEYRASQILVKVPPAASPAERKLLLQKAESHLKSLKEGADFADLASRESDDLSRIKGGDVGVFHSGQTEPQFDEAVRGMKVGDLSGIVETMNGYHIIKLVDRKEPRQIPYNEVKEKILTQLKDAERKRLFDHWLDGLKAKAKISYPAEG